jgi:hypothetical protein
MEDLVAWVGKLVRPAGLEGKVGKTGVAEIHFFGTTPKKLVRMY